jgi:hypothetical protein
MVSVGGVGRRSAAVLWSSWTFDGDLPSLADYGDKGGLSVTFRDKLQPSSTPIYRAKNQKHVPLDGDLTATALLRYCYTHIYGAARAWKWFLLEGVGEIWLYIYGSVESAVGLCTVEQKPPPGAEGCLVQQFLAVDAHLTHPLWWPRSVRLVERLVRVVNPLVALRQSAVTIA